MISIDSQSSTRSSDTTQDSTDHPINICHVVGSIGHGGRESLLEEIIKESPEHLDYVVCGMRVRDGYEARFEQLGAETVSFQAESDRDLKALLRMARFFYNRTFDIIHAHGPNAQIPSRLISPVSGSSVISTVHGVPSMFPEKLLRLERLTRPIDARTVAVSNGVKHAFIGDSASRQWQTIQNGIDVDAFQRDVSASDTSSIEDQYRISEDDFVYLNIGRYVPPKAQLDLIEATAVLVEDRSDVHLFIVGGRGAMEGRLRNRVEEYGLTDHITVTGQVDDIHPFYARADVFVSSSVGEGLPIVQLEAMAAQLPVIATDIPGVRELVVDGETGILVPPKSPARLANAMLEITNRDDLARFGGAGYDRVRESFHISNTVSDYVSLYHSLSQSQGWIR